MPLLRAEEDAVELALAASAAGDDKTVAGRFTHFCPSAGGAVKGIAAHEYEVVSAVPDITPVFAITNQARRRCAGL